MTIATQTQHLIELGVPAMAGMSVDTFTDHSRSLPDLHDGTVVVHPGLVPANRLATLLSRKGKPGFVVADMTDLDEFTPIEGLTVPNGPLYLIHNVDRGDDMRNWSPDEALPEIQHRGRSPLTINEGISWLLHQPDRLEPNRCFMTIGSRKKKNHALDARTPAIWISGGTGRDGNHNRGAPKIGWCWAGNRHTWLGFATATHRTPLPGVSG